MRWEQDGCCYEARVGIFTLEVFTGLTEASAERWLAWISYGDRYQRSDETFDTPDAAKAAAIALLRRICGEGLSGANKLEAGE